MTNRLLEGFRALDLTDEKGFVCGKVLAAMGVDVIKVERPGGDPSRNIPPFIDNDPGPEKSLLWLVNNTDKRGITLNLETAKGQDLFKQLVECSDFIIESFTPGYLEALGLGYEALSRLNRKIIMTSITSFGQKGPYSRYKGGELIASAMSGVLLSNGYADRAPVKEALDAHYFHANGAAVLGSVMAHYYREATGEGQQVDVSAQEVGVSRNTNNILPYLFDKRMLKRSGDSQWLGLNPARWIWECKDGYVWHNLMGGKVGAPANQALSQWMDDDGLENPLREIKDWTKFDRSTVTLEEKTVREKAIAKFFLGHTKKELDTEGRRRGVNAAVANTPDEVVEHPQLKARDYWVELEHDELGRTMRYPGHFYLSTETTTKIKHRAPLVGEHNQEVYKGLLGLSDSELSALKDSGVI